jgi:hypothetical protein
MLFKVISIICLITLTGCGGGSPSTSDSGSGGSDTSGGGLFTPNVELGFIQCQCASCIAGVVATSTNPIAALAFRVNTTSAPSANSENWIPVNGATSIRNNYEFSVPVVNNCTAYQNSEICSFAKGLDGQIAGGTCQTVRRIY